MAYETARLLASQSYQHWVSEELFSFEYCIILGVLFITYAVWIKLLDKSKIIELLLFGSLCAVGFGLGDIVLASYKGFWEYKVAVFPIEPPVFIVSNTLGPIVYMIVHQYNSTWKDYFIWANIGTAILIGITSVYSFLGIMEFHNWNYLYHYLYLLTGGTIGRAVLLWIISIERNHFAVSQVSPLFTGFKPAATKPLQKYEEEDINKTK